jgi:ribosomal protein S18 acetylase RimI-like enzyme
MGPGLEIRKVDWGSPAYALTVALRYDMLREPLGLHFNLNDLDREQDSMHWAGFSKEGEVLACLILRPASASSLLPENSLIPMEEVRSWAFQMRQVAVKPSHQGLGLGRQLVRHCENWLNEQTKNGLIFLHARPRAVGFYEKLGYRSYHEPITEVGLLHTRMFKAFLPQE